MFKPFNHYGIQLEAPYYDADLLQTLVRIPKNELSEMGGKPGLMARVFEEDLGDLGVGGDFLSKCVKVRLQDASDGGEGGITTLLLKAGCDQRRAIEIYNESFGATLDPKLDAARLGLM